MKPIQIKRGRQSSYVSYSAQIIPETKQIQYGPDESWDRYVQRQPDWMKSLLRNVMFFTNNGEPDFHKIWKEMRKAEYLLMVSDGSVRLISSMTYGWILIIIITSDLFYNLAT